MSKNVDIDLQKLQFLYLTTTGRKTASNTDELQSDELEGVRSGKYTKEMLSFIKSSVDRFGSLEEFQKCIKNSNHIMQI